MTSPQWPTQEQVEYARHVQRTALVDTVEQAFAFCLDSLDEENIRVPQITIQPIMTYDTDSNTGGLPDGQVRYEVAVAGHAD